MEDSADVAVDTADSWLPFEPTLGTEHSSWAKATALLRNDPAAARKSLKRIATDEQADVNLRAAAAVLTDLLDNHYTTRWSNQVLEVSPTTFENWTGDRMAFRELQRSILQREKAAQLRQRGTRALVDTFLQRQADGRPLFARFLADPKRLARDLRSGRPDAVKPYLQLAAPGAIDKASGVDLHELWRFLRLTWSLPFASTPGRSMQYLVRDSAQEHHPVVGLLALTSPIIQVTARDDWIGWTTQGLRHHLWKQGPNSCDLNADVARELVRVIDETLAEAKSNIYSRDIVDGRQSLARQIADLERLVRSMPDSPAAVNLKQLPRPLLKTTLRPFYRLKRARVLLAILRAQAALEERSADPAQTLRLWLAKGRPRHAVSRALMELKKMRLNQHVVELSTCGAIAPYGPVLGGKLVAMMAGHPQIRKDFNSRYADQASLIASVMAGRKVVRAPKILIATTTSLYETHSSQYERVTLGKEPRRTKLVCVGKTLGYTGIHLSSVTARLLVDVVRASGARLPANTFGAGVNPRMRAISAGLSSIGLSPELLKAHTRRLVYGFELATNARACALGLEKNPRWVVGDDSAGSIGEEWLARWAVPRAAKLPLKVLHANPVSSVKRSVTAPR